MKEAQDISILVVGLCGSLRADGHTRAALQVALQGAAQTNARTNFVDLADFQLPFCDGRRDAKSYGSEVERLRAILRPAHGIILGTPEYHGSYSGVLKNALDLMGFEEFEGKMVGLLGVAAGRMGALNALNGLRTIGRALHAWVIPEQVSIPEAYRVFDAQNQPTRPELNERLIDLGRQVARFAYLHHSQQALEFMRAWEQAPPNPGGYSES
jgi:NAD(P)H-dependent FMN reductase